MKSTLAFICIALFVAVYTAVNACDPNSNNQPDCSNSSNVQVNIRNFWDPTRYWWCESTSSTAQAVICPPINGNTTGFDPTQKECVPWKNWTWTAYCP
ncbi:uncharacterized protein LOC122626486 [Drosophila teissieri]|uniref:uncharacterized protein LOC122626486 n=1 Tax=Drosophila teissieri TaxID=7243 RepID=UPI001CBA3F49|nr:uncharacterized protein LOC122626486 [Drosophila teissieri]